MPTFWHDDADIRRKALAGYLAVGQHLDQLALAAGGIDGRHVDHVNTGFVARGECVAQRLFRLRHVVFDGDHAGGRLHDVTEDAHTLDDLVGAFALQAVVTGDVGLAFDAVDHQQLDGVTPRQLGTGREARAAETDDAGGADSLQQGVRGGVQVIQRGRTVRRRAVLAVGRNHDAGCRQAGRVRHRARFHHQYGAGGGGMHRCTDATDGLRDQLAPANVVAGTHQALGRLADVLCERQNELRRDAGRQYRPAGCRLAAACQPEAAVETVALREVRIDHRQ